MLTKTQRDWASAQVGKDRVAAVEGEITAATATEDDDSYILEVTGPNGRVELPVNAPADVLAAMQDAGMTVRLEGKVTGIQLDEENGRVGLEISGKSGTTVEWVVPEISEEERVALTELNATSPEEASVAKEQESEEFDRRVKSVMHSSEEASTFKNRILSLVDSDNDVRAALGLELRVEQ